MNPKTVYVMILIVASLLLALPPNASAAKSGPYDLWWEYATLGSDRYPGGTMFFHYTVINSGTMLESLDSIQLDTPWETFVDRQLPLTLSRGEGYSNTFTISIPANQRTGNVSAKLSISARYQTVAGGWFPFNPISQSFSVKILPNPFTLQRDVTSLQSELTNLRTQLARSQSNISSLQGQLRDSRNTVADLQRQMSDGQSTITNLQSQLRDAQDRSRNVESQLASFRTQLEQTRNQLTQVSGSAQRLTGELKTAKDDLADTQAKLAARERDASATQAKLSATEARLNETESILIEIESVLSSTRDQLELYGSIYLPLATVIPTLATVSLVALYLRRKRAGPAVQPSLLEGQPAPAAAPGKVLCNKCGTENAQGALFCKSCGKSMSDSAGLTG